MDKRDKIDKRDKGTGVSLFKGKTVSLVPLEKIKGCAASRAAEGWMEGNLICGGIHGKQ